MYTIVAIDDEQKVIETIKNYISESSLDAKIVGQANNVIDGIKVINTEKPDLVLLDIEMPYSNGFDLLESYPERDFEVIFVTAYDQFAVKAFQVNAINYVLKPFDENILINAIKNAMKGKRSSKPLNPDTLINMHQKKAPKKIKITSRAGIEYVDVESIISIEADGNYSNIVLDSATEIYTSNRISKIEKDLPKHNFFRSHKSHIINLNKVERYSSFDNSIIMSDNSVVALAQNKKEDFFDKMEELL